MFLLPFLFPLSVLICLSAVASRSAGAQEEQDLDPLSNHAMGGSLERSHREAWRNCSTDANMHAAAVYKCEFRTDVLVAYSASAL